MSKDITFMLNGKERLIKQDSTGFTAMTDDGKRALGYYSQTGFGRAVTKHFNEALQEKLHDVKEFKEQRITIQQYVGTIQNLYAELMSIKEEHFLANKTTPVVLEPSTPSNVIDEDEIDL